MKAKKVHNIVQANQVKVAELDAAIADAYNGGLKAIKQAILDLGYDLKPESKIVRKQIVV